MYIFIIAKFNLVILNITVFDVISRLRTVLFDIIILIIAVFDIIILIIAMSHASLTMSSRSLPALEYEQVF